MSLSEKELDEAINLGEKLNEKVNSILEKNNISLKDIVQMDHYGYTYIFGVQIDESITEEEIISIVKLTPKENYEKDIDFFGTWPCDIPYYEYYDNIIENSIKNLIETMLYVGLSTDKQNIEFVIREFYNFNNKSECDSFLENFPPDHPIKKCYAKVSNINFKQVKLLAFVKMAMWQIKNKVSNWDFIYSEETVTDLVEKINEINAYAVGHFIKENEILLEKEPNKYNYLFMILYKIYSYIYYCGLVDYKVKIFVNHYNDENDDWNFIFTNYTDILIKQLDLIENYKFDDIYDETSTLAEKLKYVQDLYKELTPILGDRKDYELEKKYCKKNINFLEQYPNKHNIYTVKEYLCYTYNIYACILWDEKGTINDESDQYEYKSIDLCLELLKEKPEKKIDYYLTIAIYYCNMAIEYFKAYNTKKINTKEKYIELFKKAIYYREEVLKFEKFNNISLKIKNYFELGRMNFFIDKKEKGKEYFEKVVDICKENECFNFWIEKINEFVKSSY